ncbi:hypothetical protein AMECASPLE_010457 [Ameca splendens]|uniref:Secreted protein n=1 Tax=Ameca splendens TaxID=208324 RepID=A0ABV0ZXD8_9TELE
MTSGRVAGRALNVVIVQHIICHVLSVCGRGGVAVCRVKCEEELDKTTTTPVDWTDNLSRGEDKKMRKKRIIAQKKPEAFSSLETCHVTFGCQHCARRSKGAAVHISWKCRATSTTTVAAILMDSAASLWMVRLITPRPTNMERRCLSFHGGLNIKAPISLQ